MKHVLKLGIMGLMFVGLPLTAARSQAATTTFSFKHFQVGTLANEVCPNSTNPCTNQASEPQIRADKSGTFYGTSENGLSSGTEAWKSTDGGLHYLHLTSPNQASTVAPGEPVNNISPAGGDTDLATAPVKNSAGHYNVYVASLELTNIFVSTSMDGGKTWQLNPAAASIPGDDREWIAADGASKVCVSYHDLGSVGIHVDCSLDAGKTFTQLAEAQDTNHVYTRTNFMIGNLAIDPNNHYIYQTFSSIDSGDITACNTASSNCNYHVVYMAVSTDGGNTFTDYPVYDNPNRMVSYGHQFTNVSVDKAGNVYSVYCDNQNIYYSYSTNHGKTWSGPYVVSKAPATTAIFPWSSALGAGKIDIVYYGTSYPTGGNGCSQNAVTCQQPDNYPATAKWYVYMAQNLSALTSHSFTQVTAMGTWIHTGGVCEGGVSCTGNRDLYDDFGVAASPTTGLASIIFSDDQDDPAQPTQCTESQDNTATCDHTMITTQTGGPGLL